MSDDRQWDQLSQKLFSRPEVQAPSYLWTRVLAAIEEKEAQIGAWWHQLRWMGKIATAMALFVTIVAGAVVYEELEAVPLEGLLQGTTTVANHVHTPTTEEITTAWLVEGSSSWETN